MDSIRLPKKAYKMLLIYDEKGKTNWVTNIRVRLSQYGFGHVWVNQGVGNMKEFIRVFRERLIDCRWQNWNSHVTQSDRFTWYRMLNSSHSIPLYLLLDIDRHMKRMMTMFRFGISDIFVHSFRYKQYNLNNLICPLCKIEVENETHFIFTCKYYEKIRQQYIPQRFLRNPCLHRLNMLLSCRNENVIRNLVIYLYRAFRYRNTAIA
jgi:hypothetical protein